MYCLLMSIIVLGGVVEDASAAGSQVLTESCSSCLIDHPQHHYCNSMVVMRIKVTSPLTRNVGLDSSKPGNYHLADATVLTDFKPGVLAAGTSIKVFRPVTFCAKLLSSGYEYVITGRKINSENGNDVFWVNSCDLGERWDELSDGQRNGFTTKYREYCADCTVTGAKTAFRTRMTSGDSGYEHAMTYWTPYRNCYYNPHQSGLLGLKDCETEEGFCNPSNEGAGCSWQLTDDYVDCFKEREATTLELEGSPAFTDITQCKLLPRGRRRECQKRFRG